MKKALFILSTLLFQLNSFAQYTAIPDVNFEQKLINLGYDSGAIDHKVLTSNINFISILEIYDSSSISDFTGIQDFVALSLLTIYNSKATTINFSVLPNLIGLACTDNKQLTSIDISGLSALEGLTCTNNNLTNLNLSGLTALKNVVCNENLFSNIKLSGLPSLETFQCVNNKIKLTSVELSDLPVLWVLECMNNQLTNIVFSEVPALKFLYCNNNILTSLDVSSLTALTYFQAFNNPLLSCIQVDDIVAAMANSGWSKDGSTSYSLNCALATSSYELTNPVTVFPNPTKDILTLQFSGTTIINKIFITDLTGKTVLQQMLTSNQVNVQNLAKGMYILQAYSGKEKYTTKFAKE